MLLVRDFLCPVLYHHAGSAISTLIDMRSPSSEWVVAPGICAMEHCWYSSSVRVNSHSGISILSTGAWITALESLRRNSGAFLLRPVFDFRSIMAYLFS